MRTPDDLPGLGRTARVFEIVGEEIDKVDHRIDDVMGAHVEQLHKSQALAALPRRPPLKAIPFRRDSIPGSDLERIVEILETEPEADEHQVAQRFGYPLSLLRRELADHQANFGRFLWLRARG